MAIGERREAFGSSRCKLVHVAAATATAAAGISPTSAPASTSQRKMNHTARKAALGHHPSVVAPAGPFRLPKDPLIREYLDRYRMAPTSRPSGAAVLDKLSLSCHATNATPAGGSRYHLVRSWTRGIARGSNRHSL